MNEEKQAERLARWLDSPESEDLHDLDLDDDVIESLTALRPDLAPGPRLTADDILASLTEGPLAERQRSLVTGPVGTPEPANRPMTRRWWSAAGGAGGIGLALAAAAALLVVVRADLAPPAPDASATLQEAAAPMERSRKGDAIVPEQEGTNIAGPAVAVTAGPPELKQAPVARVASGAAAPERSDKLASPVEPLPPATIGRSSPVLDDAVPDEFTADAVADADVNELEQTDLAAAKDEEASYKEQNSEANAPSAPPAGASGYGGLPPDDTREESMRKSAAAKPKKSSAPQGSFDRAQEPSAEYAGPAQVAPPPSTPPAAPADGWSSGLDGQTLARFEAARSSAASFAAGGDPARAATVLAAVVGPPARAGQHHAAIAARYWIQAGAPDRAAAVVRQGLALSSEETPERRALVALLQAIEPAAR